MDTPDRTDAEYRTGLTRDNGSTAIPRWTLDPMPGHRDHREPVDDRLVAAARALAASEDTTLGVVLLAVHAIVLATLCDEPDVVTGHRAPGGPVPLRIRTGVPSWRELLRGAARARAAVLAQAGADDSTARRTGTTGPELDSVVDLDDVFSADDASDPDEPTVPDGAPAVTVRMTDVDGAGITLVLGYRTDVLAADAAARLAGYHLTALAHAVTGPDDDPRAACLVGEAERRFQVHRLAGPPRSLPDRRAHELVERQASLRPDAVAAVQGARSWTYRELDERSNRLGRALLQRGLGPEDVVAVVIERSLEWLAAVLGVLKAGGVYLPVEPAFPAGRIVTVLERAGCRFALTESGESPSLDAALESVPTVERSTVSGAWEEVDDPSPLGVVVAADRLAYIYFTSGSTGQPKGAMCEHAGMLNHLLAKIDDLEIGEGSVVAQTAPQCFDISLWQLLAALVVGGRTVLIGQDEILDVRRFLDTVETTGVEVLQLVPSYLEVVLDHLEREPRELPRLRRVSATGEALRHELVVRWFAARPGTALVNAYGLTETSDDTNHAVLYGVPDGDRVPLGPPIPGVHVYVVDENLAPVPLGAPGEIVFSGVCVGRGYIGDPERTRAAFVEDPLRPGERLYRSGDRGRWRPDGSLEFLGRRDTQVKIRGFRIEIGEVDNALLRIPGVRDAAVVVAERGSERELVAFWSGPVERDPVLLRDHLSRSLPGYMVPAAIHHVPALPLTANGKIDRKALAARAAVAAPVRPSRDAPVTPTERRIAEAFARVLGLDPDGIGRHDDFFARGGTSLSAVKLVLALHRDVRLPDVVARPVLSDLATLLDHGARPARASDPAPATDTVKELR